MVAGCPSASRLLSGALLLAVLLSVFAASSANAVDKKILRWLRQDPPPKIKEIKVTFSDSLHHYFSNDQVEKRLYARKPNWKSWLTGDRRTRVQRETLQRDTLEVKYLYLSNGFLNVRIDHSYEPIPREKDTVALVRVAIQEGEQYRYGYVDLTGHYDPYYTGRFRGFTNHLKFGDPINPFRLKDISDEMKTFLANQGFPYAVIKYTIDTLGSPDSCKITYEVNSDDLVHFGDIRLERQQLDNGNGQQTQSTRYYPDYVGMRELTIKPGGKYRRKDILESQRRLFESGYYRTFQLRSATDTPDRLNPDFVLTVRERRPGFVNVKVGFGQSETRDLVLNLSGGVGKRNFLGSRQVELLADYSVETQRARRLLMHKYRVRGTEPWFLGTRTKWILTGEYQPRLQDPVRDFDKESWVLTSAFARQFGSKLKAEIGFQYENVKISGIPTEDVPLIKEQEGISARRKLYATLYRDSRDNQFYPTRGAVSELSGEYFGGFLKGDDSFFKILASWSRYTLLQPLGNGTVYAWRFRGGWADEFDGTKVVPIDEALYLGGASTVRGFSENKLGPLLPDGSPAGARYTLVFNQELRFSSPFQPVVRALPLIGGLFEKFPLRNSIFTDVGNGFSTREEIRLDNFAVSYGAGIQIFTPAGPVRIDYAQVLETERFAPIHRWHFTILYAF